MQGKSNIQKFINKITCIDRGETPYNAAENAFDKIQFPLLDGAFYVSA